ncbi:MAG: ribokinase [Victivallaceae bacterium]|nr:ribokinase [Victivallaceae bacterium]
MKNIEVLNLGSLNIDCVYRVDHMIAPGETLACQEYHQYPGGKGLNQSVALGRAGVKVAHAGKIGQDGLFLKKTLEDSRVDASRVLVSGMPTGHAIIEVDCEGQNSILLYPGSNCALTEEEIVQIFDSVPRGTILLLQNEINLPEFIFSEAKKRALAIAFNPAPCRPELAKLPLEDLTYLIVNEIECCQLSGGATIEDSAALLGKRCPNVCIVITLGGDGVLMIRGGKRIRKAALPVKVVDTTSAGDTFIGYFLAAQLRGLSDEASLDAANKASSIAVGRPGAACSIPEAKEVFA